MSENSTRPHSEKGVGPARRPSTRRIGASGLRNKPKWRSMRLKLAAIWRMSDKTLLRVRGSVGSAIMATNMAVVIGPGPSGFHQSPRLGCENERWPATPPLRERGRVWAKDAGLSKG
jgi:hypothetical protein